MNDLLLRACRREPVERPPVWMMRQAGRYLPQYRAVREHADFLTMVGTPELAVEVTLQPVELLGVDAAIIFSDILVVPQAMGMELTVEEGVGPRFHRPLRAAADFDSLADIAPEDDLRYVLDAIRLARRDLGERHREVHRSPRERRPTRPRTGAITPSRPSAGSAPRSGRRCSRRPGASDRPPSPADRGRG